MRIRSRRRLLLVVFCIAAPMWLYTWMVVSDEHPNNPVGVLLGLVGLLVVFIVYLSSGITFWIEWLIARIRKQSAHAHGCKNSDKIDRDLQ